MSKFIITSKKIMQCKVESLQDLEQSQIEYLQSNIQSGIRHIVLAGNSYSKQFCQEFSELLKTSTNLEIVDAHDTFVSRLKDELPEAIGFLAQGMIGKQILELNFSDNAVNPYGAIALSAFLEQASSLKSFYINNAGLGIDGVTTIAEALSKGTPNLEKFQISRNRAENEGAIEIAKSLPSLPKLKELVVSQDVIKEEGMVSLLNSLSENCLELALLDLQDNFLGAKSIKELSKLIKLSTNLVSLNISDCNIACKDNECILEAIENSESQFEEIEYNYSEINDEQAIRLVDTILKKNKTIKRLGLNGNDFEEETKKALKEKLEQQNSLISIQLNFDSDSEDDEEQTEGEKDQEPEEPQQGKEQEQLHQEEALACNLAQLAIS